MGQLREVLTVELCSSLAWQISQYQLCTIPSSLSATAEGSNEEFQSTSSANNIFFSGHTRTSYDSNFFYITLDFTRLFTTYSRITDQNNVGKN